MIGRALLAEVAEALESDPELAARVRTALGLDGPATAAAETLRLRDAGPPVRTLRAAIARGELAAMRVGREYRVRRGDLEAWLESRRVAPGRRERQPKKQSAAERAVARARRAGSLRVVGGR